MGERRGAYRVLEGEREGKRPLERPRLSFEDIIKIDLQETGWGVDWTDLTHCRYRWRALLNSVRSSTNCERFLV